MTDANGGGHGDQGDGGRKVTSLRDLPRSMQPSRDLWTGIEAAIAAERQGKGSGPAFEAARPRRASPAGLRGLAVAATVAALAVGVWIGHSIAPTTGSVTAPSTSNTSTTARVNPPQQSALTEGATAVQAAYLSDPKFRQERAALVKSLETKLAALPPDSREKVISSLATIHKSKQDLEDALGKDPTNALLQELLLNTYQDEMRVLTTVHEASDAGKGI